MLLPYLAHALTNDNCLRMLTGKICIDSFPVSSSQEQYQTLEYLLFGLFYVLNLPLESIEIVYTNHRRRFNFDGKISGKSELRQHLLTLDFSKSFSSSSTASLLIFSFEIVRPRQAGLK